MAVQMRTLTLMAFVVAAMAVVFAEESTSFAHLAPEGEHEALGDAKASKAGNAAQAAKAKAAVDSATKSLSKADVEKAYRETAKAAGAPTDLVKDSKASMATDAKAAAKAKAKAAGAKSAAAKVGSEKDVEKALAAAKGAHKKAEEDFAAAKVQAVKGGMKLKASKKAVQELKRQVSNSKIPVADDDARPATHLSAVGWAEKAAEEKKVAYVDHMAAAKAADAEAAASQALSDVEAQVSKLHEEVEGGQIKVSELKKLVAAARFEAEETHAKGKFTTGGAIEKLKYKEADQSNQESVQNLEAQLIAAHKKLMLSQTALANLRGSGVVTNAKQKASAAVAHLAGADAAAHVAARGVKKIVEKATKAKTLADMRAKKKEADRALKAKKEADDLMKLKKKKDDAGTTVKDLTKKLGLVRKSGEKAQKAKVQAKLAAEKVQKNKAMMLAMSAKGKNEAAQKKASLMMKEAGSKAAKGKGTPCDTCLAKCSTDVCRTWCNAQWCDGKRGTAHKKEVATKLKAARKVQKSAAAAVQQSADSMKKP